MMQGIKNVAKGGGVIRTVRIRATNSDVSGISEDDKITETIRAVCIDVVDQDECQFIIPMTPETARTIAKDMLDMADQVQRRAEGKEVPNVYANNKNIH